MIVKIYKRFVCYDADTIKRNKEYNKEYSSTEETIKDMVNYTKAPGTITICKNTITYTTRRFAYAAEITTYTIVFENEEIANEVYNAIIKLPRSNGIEQFEREQDDECAVMCNSLYELFEDF